MRHAGGDQAARDPQPHPASGARDPKTGVFSRLVVENAVLPTPGQVCSLKPLAYPPCPFRLHFGEWRTI